MGWCSTAAAVFQNGRPLLEAPRFREGGEVVGRMTGQNIQARLRALRMWSWCNATESLFLQ
jgi:hypothetical protein